MRHVVALVGAGALGLLAGCQSPAHIEESHAPFNAWTMEELTTQQEHNAIIRQRTIFPYHFVPDSAELTQVGERDVAVLADHFSKVSGGQVNLRRGDASEGLYAARAETLRTALAERGVTAGAVTVGDDIVGGDGISSRRALILLERSDESRPAGLSMPSGGAASGGASTGEGR